MNTDVPFDKSQQQGPQRPAVSWQAGIPGPGSLSSSRSFFCVLFAPPPTAEPGGDTKPETLGLAGSRLGRAELLGGEAPWAELVVAQAACCRRELPSQLPQESVFAQDACPAPFHRGRIAYSWPKTATIFGCFFFSHN